MTDVHVVVPDGVDDPTAPSGGNTYDRHVSDGLASLGWSVHEHAVGGGWPAPDPASRVALQAVVARVPDGGTVLLDGLVACAAPEVLVAQAGRLRLVVLVHMPLGHRPLDDGARARERTVLSASAEVVTTSMWARDRLFELYGLATERVHVAVPGVQPAALACGSASGGTLLCVAAVTYDKGHDVLLDALMTATDLPWRCVCVGSLDRAPAFAADLRRRVLAAGLAERVCLCGARTGADLDRCYAAADLLVLASRAETYGMVVTEALARGLPVLAAAVGGLPEALGHGANGSRPGLLVAPEDPMALGAALRCWLCDAQLRVRLRHAARERRASLPRWSTTTATVAGVLTETTR